VVYQAERVIILNCKVCGREVNRMANGDPIPEGKKVVCNECLEAKIKDLGL
jgi:hypothetical protein